MLIKRILVNNFRNLDEITIDFNRISNYIIGENNLGKSNLFDLLYIVFNGKRFEETDFGDTKKRIEAIITMILNNDEKGFFEDNFSAEDSSLVTISYTQSIDESFPEVKCIDTEEKLSSKILKKIHYFKYSSTASPTKELKFDSPNGAGKVFKGIIDLFLKNPENRVDFLNNEAIEALATFINGNLNKIKGFTNYGIQATVAEKPYELLSNLFFLSDGTRRIETTGSGIQYIAMVTLNIISQIMEVYRSRSSNFNDHVYSTQTGKRLFPIIIALDEPEVHLHPYLQRSLISYYKKIITNQDSEFLELLKRCFDIDGLSGQLLIVTHSSDILMDDYRNIIRFYKDNSTTRAISGVTLDGELQESARKQLLMHFHELRETFYAHAVIIVEGETEYGAFPIFASKIGIPIDDLCISIIMAQGEASIKPIKQLLNAFKIKTVTVYDGDVKSNNSTDDSTVFFTNEKCFEIEVFSKLYSNGQIDTIKTIAKEIKSDVETVMDWDFVRKGMKYLGKSIDEQSYTPRKLSDIDENDVDDFCTMYKIWYMKAKGVISGRIYGEYISKDYIPDCYINALNKAKEISSNGNC